MKISRTNNAFVLVGSKSEIKKSLEVMSQQYRTVQEWINHSNGKSLYVVK